MQVKVLNMSKSWTVNVPDLVLHLFITPDLRSARRYRPDLRSARPSRMIVEISHCPTLFMDEEAEITNSKNCSLLIQSTSEGIQ